MYRINIVNQYSCFCVGYHWFKDCIASVYVSSLTKKLILDFNLFQECIKAERSELIVQTIKQTRIHSKYSAKYKNLTQNNTDTRSNIIWNVNRDYDIAVCWRKCANHNIHDQQSFFTILALYQLNEENTNRRNKLKT